MSVVMSHFQLVVFLVWFLSSAFVVDRIKLGIDRKTAVPEVGGGLNIQAAAAKTTRSFLLGFLRFVALQEYGKVFERWATRFLCAQRQRRLHGHDRAEHDLHRPRLLEDLARRTVEQSGSTSKQVGVRACNPAIMLLNISAHISRLFRLIGLTIISSGCGPQLAAVVADFSPATILFVHHQVCDTSKQQMRSTAKRFFSANRRL